MHLRGAHRTGHYCDYLSELEEVDLHTPKPPKWHIKHELNAHLSTSTLADSSPLVSSKRWFLISCPPQPYGVSKVFSAENLNGVLVFYLQRLNIMPSHLELFRGICSPFDLTQCLSFQRQCKDINFFSNYQIIFFILTFF